MANSFGEVGGKKQSFTSLSPLDDPLKPRLENGDITGPKTFYFFLVNIDAGDMVTGIRQTGSADQSHIARSNDSEFHPSPSTAQR